MINEWVKGLVERAIESQRTTSDTCPCCERPYVIYRRRFPSATASLLIEFYGKVGSGPGHLPSLLNRRSTENFTAARLWGLIEPAEVPSKNGASPHKSGWWQITTRGIQFINGQIRVPPVVLHGYDQAILDSGEVVKIPTVYKYLPHKKLGRKVSIIQVLQSPGFDYEELMS
jgi:hypothetical protein